MEVRGPPIQTPTRHRSWYWFTTCMLAEPLAPRGGQGLALGARIAEWRRERCRTQADLASAAGVGLETLRKLEQGRTSHPSVFRVAALATALGVTVDELIGLRPRHPIGSVGYEGRDIDSFLASITKDRVDLVADVRLTPVSRKKGFSKSRLQGALAEVGVEYVHLPALGNAKEDRPLFAGSELEVGRARFRAGLRRPEARSDLAALAQLTSTNRVALLCFEQDERRCHRSVVAEELAQLG